jgi:hypothetical protein
MEHEDKDKDRNKLYREKNKEILKQKSKQYYQNNCDKIKSRRKEKVECTICKCEITKESLYRHKKSKLHLENMQKN